MLWVFLPSGVPAFTLIPGPKTFRQRVTVRAQNPKVSCYVIEGVSVNVVYVERGLAGVRVYLIPPTDGTLVVSLLKQMVSDEVGQLKTNSPW